jgi:hypothetical protein
LYALVNRSFVYTAVDAFTQLGPIYKAMTLHQLQRGAVRYCFIAFALLHGAVATSNAQQKITLRETHKVGETWRVDASTEQNGSLDTVADPKQPQLPKRLAKTGKARSQYAERILQVDEQQLGAKTLRQYTLLDAEQRIGDETTRARLRNQVQHVVLDRQSNQAVTFSPDGPLQLGELEQVRTDIFLPRLTGLLPSQTVDRGSTWTVATPAVLELTDLQSLQAGSLECTLSSIEGDVAMVKFAGQVTGTTPSGSNQQTLQGSYRFDLKASRIVALQFEVTSLLRDRQNKAVGDITARFQLTRYLTGVASISTTGLTLEANEENTLLLVQEPRIGLEFLHSRRWVPSPVNDQSWRIDGPSGSGLTLQFEPANNIPDMNTVRKPIEATLSKTVQQLKPLPDPAGWNGVQRLSWTGTQNGKEYVFEYFLYKQGAKGAIVAGRYHAPDATLAQKDAERILRSLRVGP